MSIDLYRTLRALRSHERGIKPDPTWVAATRQRLLMQVKNSMPTPEVMIINRKFSMRLWDHTVRIIRGPIAAVAAIVAVIFGGSLASVRAAEKSLPGDALFGLKLVAEQTQLALESSATGKVKLKVEFTKRRVQELQTILNQPIAQQTERAGTAADIINQDLHTLKDQLASVSLDDSSNQARDVAETAKAVDSGVTEVAKTLNETKKDTTLDPDLKQKMADAEAQALDVGMNAIVTLVQATKNETAKDVASPSDINASLAQHVGMMKDTLDDMLKAAPPASTDTASSSKQNASSTTVSLVAITKSSSTSSGALAQDAVVALAQAEAFIQESKIVEATDKIKEANQKSLQAQTAVAADLAFALSASSTAITASSTTIASTSSTQLNTTTTASSATTTTK
jgi:hypothetical protein